MSPLDMNQDYNTSGPTSERLSLAPMEQLQAHPIPEYTSIVIRQTSPSATLLQPPPQQDIEEVAIESLPEMVTELFDSISNQSTVAALPISSAPMTKKMLSSSQIKLEPSFSVNNT